MRLLREYSIVLFGIFPVLHTVANNTQIFGLEDLGAMFAWGLGSILFTAIFYILFKILTKNKDFAAIGAIALIIFISYGGGIAASYPKGGRYVIAHLSVFGCYFIFLTCLFLLRNHKSFISNISISTKVIAAVLIAFAVIETGKFDFIEKASTGEFITEQNSEPKKQISAENLPDIYYIILDGYPRKDVLKGLHRFDNSYFTNSLEKAGFIIPDLATSNYSHTHLSLSSSLNLSYLNENLLAEGKNSGKWETFRNLIEKNKVQKLLKAKSYRYIQYKTWYENTSGSPMADEIFPAYNNNILTLGIVESTFLELIDQIYSISGRENYLERSFDKLGQDLANGKKGNYPKFTFVHIICPHAPYVFGKNGHRSPVQAFKEKLAAARSSAGKEELYTNQLTYLNKRILEILNKRKPGYEPIIIIQGDHGSQFLSNNGASNANSRSVLERMAILAAYYFPEKYRNQIDIYPTITPVNAMRSILGKVLNENLPLLEDINFFDIPKGEPVADLDVVTDWIKGKSFKEKESKTLHHTHTK